MNLSQFRTDFPEFADTARFPDAMLTLWAGVGEQRISAERFDTLYGTAVALFAAHNLVLAVSNRLVAAQGGVPGSTGGIISSKSVGDVSVSYDTGAAMEPNAGHWNATTYGRQYIQLARLMGGGCVQL